jgi:cardiolipin synthase
MGIGSAVGAAITNRRLLGPAEARVMGVSAAALLLLSIVAVKWPRVITYPLAFFGVWTAIALFVRAYRLHRRGAREDSAAAEPAKLPAGDGGRVGQSRLESGVRRE